MKQLIWAGLITLGLSLPGFASYTYPEAPQDATEDVYHGVKVKDPFRPLENPDDPKTKAWVDAQNGLSQSYLNTSKRPEILSALEKLQNYPKYGTPFRAGPFLYYWHNNGLQNQYVLYQTAHLDLPGKAILDPNTLSTDGTVSVMRTHFSPDGRYLAYALSYSGSDWQELHIRDLTTGQDTGDVLKHLKFSSVAWKPDNSGFYYNRYPAPGTVEKEAQHLNNKVFFHTLGAPQASDRLIYQNPKLPKMAFYPELSHDGRYLYLYGSKSSAPINRLYVRQEGSTPTEFKPLFDKDDAEYNMISTEGHHALIQTTAGAPRGKLIKINLKSPQETQKTLIPQQKGVLSSIQKVGQNLVASYMQDAHHQMTIFDLKGDVVKKVKLPTVGSLGSIKGREMDQDFYFGFTSFLFPSQAYHYNLKTQSFQAVFQPQLDFDPEQYTAKQVFYRSKDGTRVPMFVVHKKGLILNGNNPTLLYAYGGFTLSMTPYFSPSLLYWLEQGGVYAMANLRGGGEYGEEWHQAGMLEKKQNVFDDFISGAQWLIDHKYTRPDKLAIQGGSNGGLLTTATMLQRPDLFGAVISQVPVTDMLRYHKFTVGRYWIPEYGNAEADPNHFKFLMAYSPLHNIKPQQKHPPVLLTTADHDDRVVPAHSYKFVATLQKHSAGESPVLLRVDTKAGHGAGKPTKKRLEEQADLYAFLFKALNAE